MTREGMRVKEQSFKSGFKISVLAIAFAGVIASARCQWALGADFGPMAAADTNSAAAGVDAAGNSADGGSLMDNAQIDPVTGKPETNLNNSPGQIDPVTGKPENAPKPSTLPGDEDDYGAPSPSPSPSPALESGTDQDENQPPVPEAEAEPTPTESSPEVIQPLPGAMASQQSNSLLNQAANPALEMQFDQWDVSQVGTPLFLNEAVDEFNQRPVNLTGNWSVKPHLSIGSYYDGNIFLANNGAQSDYVMNISPGLDMRLGNDDSLFYLTADYTYGYNYYIQHPDLDDSDQNLRTQLQWTMPRTVVSLSAGVTSSEGQDVDAGSRIRQNLYSLALDTHYDFSEKTSWAASASYSRADFNGLIDSAQYEGDLYFDYQYSPKTQFGIGGAVGDLEVPGSPHQLYEQANVRASYLASGKLTFNGQLGMELREYQGGVGSTFTPVFSLGAAWAARPGTSMTLTGSRSMYASAILNDQDYTATSFDFTIQQRITDYVDVSFSAGFVNSAYSATATNVDAPREDNYYYLRPAIEWRALSWMSVGIFYEFSQDLSSGTGGTNSFSRDRGGVNIGILF
jgi:hypothetical protein